MRAKEFTTHLNEINLKKAAAAGAMALGALGANAQGIMPGDQPEIRVQQQQPSAEVVGNGDDIVVKFEGRSYQGVVLTSPDDATKIPLGAIKIKVPRAQFGIRGLGDYNVYLRKDKAYIQQYN